MKFANKQSHSKSFNLIIFLSFIRQIILCTSLYIGVNKRGFKVLPHPHNSHMFPTFFLSLFNIIILGIWPLSPNDGAHDVIIEYIYIYKKYILVVGRSNRQY